MKQSRRFNHEGRRYYISDNYKADIEKGKGKYYLSEILPDDRVKILYDNITWDVPTFGTLKEAKRYVRNNDLFLTTL